MASADWHTQSRAIMGTEVTVTLWHGNAGRGEQAIAAVMALMEDIEDRWNPEAKGSELYRVNQLAANRAVEISEELSEVVAKALAFSRRTHGVFDISFASVGRYYDYRKGIAPKPAELGGAMDALDYRLLQLDETTPSLRFGHSRMKIDLGGIAKGYAVDRAIEILQLYGVEHASVSAGGDTRLLGDRRGRPWLVGIRNPRKKDAVALLLPLEDIALSTSGDYERYFIDAETGNRVHHIINPRTGAPASGVMSSSVVGPQGFDTDPLSTTVLVLGVEQGLALINSLAEYDTVIVDSAGVIHYSDGLIE